MKRPPESWSRVPTALATSAAGCRGRIQTLAITATRSVTAAAAARVATSSGLVKVIRSPADTLENGPASIARLHATVVVGA